MTRIGDLSAQDMKKIPTLALIELTALCDVLGFELKRNKAAKLKTTGQLYVALNFFFPFHFVPFLTLRSSHKFGFQVLEQGGCLIRNLVTVVFALIGFFWNHWVVLPRPIAPHLPLSHPFVLSMVPFFLQCLQNVLS